MTQFREQELIRIADSRNARQTFSRGESKAKFPSPRLIVPNYDSNKRIMAFFFNVIQRPYNVARNFINCLYLNSAK